MNTHTQETIQEQNCFLQITLYCYKLIIPLQIIFFTKPTLNILDLNKHFLILSQILHT